MNGYRGETFNFGREYGHTACLEPKPQAAAPLFASGVCRICGKSTKGFGVPLAFDEAGVMHAACLEAKPEESKP